MRDTRTVDMHGGKSALCVHTRRFAELARREEAYWEKPPPWLGRHLTGERGMARVTPPRRPSIWDGLEVELGYE